jgi:hypothetical protein
MELLRPASHFIECYKLLSAARPSRNPGNVKAELGKTSVIDRQAPKHGRPAPSSNPKLILGISELETVAAPLCGPTREQLDGKIVPYLRDNPTIQESLQMVFVRLEDVASLHPDKTNVCASALHSLLVSLVTWIKYSTDTGQNLYAQHAPWDCVSLVKKR